MTRENSAYEAAVMYFVQDEKMETIAKKLKVSRSTVSRLIQHARETGMVRISLNPPDSTVNSLAGRLEERFGVKAFIAPVSASADSARRMQAVANLAAQVLSDSVEDETVVAAAWGNMVSAVAEQLPMKKVSGVRVVQLNGAATGDNAGMPHAGAIMEKIGEAFSAQVIHFAVPAFFDYPETRTQLWKERSVSSVIELGRNADVAIFGVGSQAAAASSLVYSGGYFTHEELVELDQAGVVGDVCTVMFRADGTFEDLDVNFRASGPSPNELTGIKKRILAVSGQPKAVAALAGLRAGVATDLVIDESTALTLLQLADEADGLR
ncbi:DNA-binding transcriptional regulator LsrR (DeoR family) [Arcanobacterium wilhelmae]|uniref:DNA-binding transcriptional regulator LsrR (DeoR family) n=1 Tax=Arcanobacterium wilhelmae TaxID=1803177 RepID=A0ABT9NA38_9ACTO|nr:sugar-binding domain-containing protein [Arcanobacterium wilhelmae]MDP9800585.1 DNA-binding transcriptional regulator LsrR (DeoR family) [Arcanobacterium wilhelmae]WFN89997.1 sugar-binding domain-containing protein [Arcanobacterium wilhelmae]